LCVSLGRGAIQCLSQFVESYLIQVLLRRVRSRVAHQPSQSTDVPITRPSEPVGEAVPKLVRRKATDAGALADPPHHPHQRLIARRHLWVFSTTTRSFGCSAVEATNPSARTQLPYSAIKAS
jgi:hypothetical protein